MTCCQLACNMSQSQRIHVGVGLLLSSVRVYVTSLEVLLSVISHLFSNSLICYSVCNYVFLLLQSQQSNYAAAKVVSVVNCRFC